MTVHISLAVTDGDTTDGAHVKFEAQIDEVTDAVEVGVAVGAAIIGVGICRKLQALAYAIRHVGDADHFEACRAFSEAADTYIEFWETQDERFKDNQ